MIFELIPVLSFFFLLTTAAGSAMWAADLEKARRRETESDAARGISAQYRDDFP
jgi:hypothetical protein